MLKTLIIKNLTGTAQAVGDLGLTIPGSGQIDVTDLFASNRNEPQESEDLSALIQANVLLLNTGTEDVQKAGTTMYLMDYAISNHEIDNDHSGDFLESRISGTNIFPRLTTGSAATITAPWSFGAGGQLCIENDTVLPTGTIPEGRVFYNRNTKTLKVGAGNVWNDATVTPESRYNAPMVYEFGANVRKYSGSYIPTAWAASNIAPVIVPYAGTLKSMVAHSTSGYYSYTCAIQKYSGGNWVTIADVSSSNGGIVIDTFNVNFDQGERLACYVASGRMYYAHCYIEIVWRQA